MATIIPDPDRARRLSTGSPEAYVHRLTDLDLQNEKLVRSLTRGLHWDPEPERFLAAAKAELEWRRENGIAFGWVKR